MTKTLTTRIATAFLAAGLATAQAAPALAQGPSVTVNTSVVVTTAQGRQVRTDTLGWIYVGHLVDGEWDWKPSIAKINGNGDFTLPRVGDEIVLLRTMNLRAEPIYRDVSGSGAVQTAKLASYGAGQRFIVATVHDVRYPDGYIWIQVAQVSSY